MIILSAYFDNFQYYKSRALLITVFNLQTKHLIILGCGKVYLEVLADVNDQKSTYYHQFKL